MSASWDDVREAQVQVIVAAAANVHEAEGWVAGALGTVRRLEGELAKATEALDNARRIRDDRTAKVAAHVEEYQHIGEGHE